MRGDVEAANAKREVEGIEVPRRTDEPRKVQEQEKDTDGGHGQSLRLHADRLCQGPARRGVTQGAGGKLSRREGEIVSVQEGQF